MSVNSNILSGKYWLACLLAFAFWASPFSASAQKTTSVSERAQYVLMLSQYVTWPGEDTLKNFTIGVYGYNAPEYGKLDTMSRGFNNKVKDKVFTVKHFRRLKDITPTEILMVSPEYNYDLPAVAGKLNGAPTLIFTADLDPTSKLLEKTMINISPWRKENENKMKVNDELASQSGLSFNENILVKGGSRVVLSKIVTGKDKELQEKERQIKTLLDSIQRQEDAIKVERDKNREKKERIDEQSYLLENNRKEIVKNQRIADSLDAVAQVLSTSLKHNSEKVKEQEESLNLKEREYESAKEELEFQTKKNDTLQNKIKVAEEELKNLDKRIGTQGKIMTFGIIFLVIVIILVIITAISNNSRKKKNVQLANINEEVNRQKDHIKAQSEQLLQYNKELEKLSIVASQTDNGVVIMDNLGNIEWVNRGFVNLYGYSTSDLKNSSTDSLTGFYASNPDIEAIKDKCLSSSEPSVFECEIKSKVGKSVWVQSTLTPILDDSGQIGRLVTIDTDITRIKEQEMAIMQQGKTLEKQRDELAVQNEFIKEQNAHISTSLTYAKTIQETVMPLEVNISKYFKYFGIFIPIQIVSGDFYWFTAIPDNPKVTFTAAVDCTGHGVPGAFMCMITTRLLTEIIVEHKVYDTKEILDQLNYGLMAALKQNETDNNDSLEICLCRFTHVDDENYELLFSGAKRPLYIYHDESGEFDTLKGDRKTIGGLISKRNSSEFTKEVVILKKNDKVYMTTDGFVNQFDENSKKYGSDRFVKLLKSISPLELPVQKIALEQEYEKYRGNADQNDDVTIFAVQLI